MQFEEIFEEPPEPVPEEVQEAVGPVAYVFVKGDNEVWVNRYQNGSHADERLSRRLARHSVTLLRNGFSLLRKGKSGPTVVWQNGESNGHK